MDMQQLSMVLHGMLLKLLRAKYLPGCLEKVLQYLKWELQGAQMHEICAASAGGWLQQVGSRLPQWQRGSGSLRRRAPLC